MPSADPVPGPPSNDPDPGAPSGFRPLHEDIVHRGWAITLVKATFLDPEDHAFERDIVRHPGAVAVVPITEQGTVILVRQYRPAVDRWLLEIPAGTCDVPGEPVEETARRELTEEVGYVAESLVLLTRCAVTPGFCDEFASLFLATGLRAVGADHQGIEEQYMELVEVELSAFDGMVDSGDIIDAQTILGVGLARRHLATER